MADHSALKLRRLTRTCGHLSGKASLDLSSSSESAVPAGLHGLSAVERYYFETQGFVVIPDIIPRCLLAELNAAMDACADQITRTTENLSGDVAALQGQFGRGDTGSFMYWPQPHCQPFRKLMALPRMVRIMLDLVGPGFHLSSANGIVMDAGAEGQRMHGGQRSDGSNGRRDAWTYTIDRNGQIECNLINCMYQLADIGPTDGGTLVVPGSHKAFFNLPESIRAIKPAIDRFGSETGGPLLKTVPCRAGSVFIFTEALSHGCAPWVAAHQRRTLLYRYSSRGFWGGSAPEKLASFADEMSPLGRAILEPAHLGNRPDIAALLAEEEKSSGASQE